MQASASMRGRWNVVRSVSCPDGHDHSAGQIGVGGRRTEGFARLTTSIAAPAPPPRSYSGQDKQTVRTCPECLPGTYQPQRNHKQTSCPRCDAGEGVVVCTAPDDSTVFGSKWFQVPSNTRAGARARGRRGAGTGARARRGTPTELVQPCAHLRPLWCSRDDNRM